MSTHRMIDRVCIIVTILAVLVTALFMKGENLGLVAEGSKSFGYEDKLFDDSYVHTINIEIDDWDALIENATSEEYSIANVTIDGDTVKGVGIRAKGNTSLSTVSQLGSERYSLKIEFDSYQDGNTYYGLDKLCLNNLIQDYTMMKDYIAYKLMNEFGADAPLASFCFVTVNGEDWGLFLAVEAVEESFLERNYGTGYGELYKPDSMSMGGGRGNGGGFDMRDMDFDEMGMKNPFEREGDGSEDSGDTAKESKDAGEAAEDSKEAGDSAGGPGGSGGFPGGGPGGGFGGFGMGSSDVKLQYSDDDIDSYSTIFGNAKTAPSKADKKRLISALKSLSEGIEEGDADKIAEAVDIDEVMRYMVVHNFVVNSDSYTGAMIHNYYLYEEDGLMSMIPWDYNLAYGTFQSGDSDGAVNDPIDTPLSITEGSTDRPMFSWITSNEEYLEMYHEYYQEFMDQIYSTGYITDLVNNTYEMIAEYVDRDPTKFCTTEEFETAVETIRTFLELRCESVQGQLDGTIGSTDSEQEANSEALVDASSINLSDMGSMGGGGGPGGGHDNGGGPGSDHDSNRGGFGGDHDSSGSDKDSSSSGVGSGSGDGSGSDKAISSNSDGNASGNSKDSNGSHSGGKSRSGSRGSHGSRSGKSSTESKSGESTTGETTTGDNATDTSENGDNAQSGFPGGDFNFPGSNSSQGGFPGGGPSGDFPSGAGFGSNVSTTDWIYAGVSVAALLAAILFALKYKTRR